MSFTPNEYLKDLSAEILRCRQHASMTFANDQFRLLPKDKFLFHVALNINWQAFNPSSVNSRMIESLKNEINLLVRSSDLPTYTVSTETLNQYNRKRVTQYQHKYNDIKMSFHDDNMGLINQVWQLYYKYYYNDPTVSAVKGAYDKTAIKKSSFISNPYGFIGRIKPFFNYITIYQMSRHEYVSYKIINPLITHWGGNNLAYHSGDSHNFDMTFAYEAVQYGTGFVNDGLMEGFGISHYDWNLSPLDGSGYPANSSSYPSFPRSTGGFNAGSASYPLSSSSASSTAAANAAGAGRATNLSNTGAITSSSTSSAKVSALTTQVNNLSGSTSSTSKVPGVTIPTSSTTLTTSATQIQTNTALAKQTAAANAIANAAANLTGTVGSTTEISDTIQSVSVVKDTANHAQNA